MKSILILNFRRMGDLLSIMPIAQFYKSAGNKVMLLTFEENKELVDVINVFDQIHYLNREILEVGMKSPLINKSFPLQHLFQVIDSIGPVDEVANTSFDKFALHIAAYYKASGATCVGQFCDENEIIRYSSKAMSILGEVNTVNPMNVNQMLYWGNYTDHTQLGCVVNIRDNYSAMVAELMGEIRSKFSPGTSAFKIVGLQTSTSDHRKNIPEIVVETLLQHIFSVPNIYPILIISFSENDLVLSNKLNEKFNNQLLVLQADLKSLTAVVNGIDLLIAPDTMIVHLADALNKPCLEIVNSSLNWKKQATRKQGNIVLGHKDLTKSDETFANSIFECLKFQADISKTIDIDFESNEELFRVITLTGCPLYLDCIKGFDIHSIYQMYNHFLIHENRTAIMKYFIQAKQDSASVINLIHAERQALESFSKLVISLLRNVQLSSEFKIEIILNCIQETQQFASSLSMTSPVLLLFGNLLDRNKNHEEHLDNVMATFDLTRDLIKKSFSFLNILEASVRSAKELSYKNNKSSKNDVLLTNLSSL